MRQKVQNENGAAAVEFALLLPLFTLILVGIIMFGLVFNSFLEITHAAREGVRWGALREDLDSIEARAQAAAPGINWALASTEVTLDGEPFPADGTSNGDQDKEVKVTITYQLTDVIGLFGAFTAILPDQISSSATQRAE